MVSTRKDIIKFFPSYVGSKAYWIPQLQEFKGRHFIEPFAGSAVISANLASSAVLNDLDPMVSMILTRFDEQIVPESFGREDYFSVRKRSDWWRYTFCLQKLSYSGVFRYSKNGFNVPIKADGPVHLQEHYAHALARWKELSPTVLNGQYYDVEPYIREDSVIIMDPPYQTAKASYNTTFDYDQYWKYVEKWSSMCDTMIIFDFVDNLPSAPVATRKTRVNGARNGNIEGMIIQKREKGS